MSTIRVNTIQDTGTNNAMTISGGTVTFTNTPSGASPIRLLKTLTVTSGNSADLNDIFSSSYKYYKIVGTDIALAAASDQKLECRVKISGQGSFDSGGSNYIRRTETFSDANANYSGDNTTGSAWVLTPSGAVEDGDNTYPMWLEMNFYDPANTTASQGIGARYELDYYSYHPYRIGNRGHLFFANNNISGVQFFWAGSGTFLSGTFKVYGYE